MDIIFNPNNTNFKSLNNPVKPFKVVTKAGDILVGEIPIDKLKKKKVTKSIAKLFCKSFSQSSEEPYWQGFYEKKNRYQMINDYIKYFQSKIQNDDGNLTMLVAKNQKGKLCGASFSYTYKEVPSAGNSTCYLDSLAIDESCRGTGLGQILVNKTMDINKNTFTDIFVKAINKAVGFYERLGFNKLAPDTPNKKYITERLVKFGEGYPDYATLMTKPLQENKPRWYELGIINNK